MKVRTQTCKNEDDTLVFLVIEEDGKTLLKDAIYIDAESVKKMPSLAAIKIDLPKLLEMVYNSGKKGETVEFINEEIELDI